MAAPTELNDLEQFLVLAAARLGGEAYGVPIRREIEKRGGRRISVAAVYAALDRLEGRGLLRHELSEPTAERGGRRRKIYAVTEAGAVAVHEARAALDRMWADLDLDAWQSA